MQINNATRREALARVKALYNVYIHGEPTILGSPLSVGTPQWVTILCSCFLIIRPLYFGVRCSITGIVDDESLDAWVGIATT